MTTTNSVTPQVVSVFKGFYAHKEAMDLTRLEDIYSENIVFRDPLHGIRSIAALRDYLAAMYENLTECRFEYLDELIGVDSAYIKWNMHFRHPRFNNRLNTVRGVSQIQFNDRVIFHEDIYDLGELIYQHVPLLGGATRWLKRRIVQYTGPTA